GPRACARHPRLPLAAPARVRGHGRRGRRPHIRDRLNGRGAPVSLTRAPARRTEFLPFAPPVIGEEEIQEVVDTLRSDWITTGPKTKRFETEFAASLDAPGALALNSCTAGLHTALATLGVGAGAEVITPPLTFTASANVIEHAGARPPRPRPRAQPARHESRRLEALRQGRELALRGVGARLQVQHDRHPGGAGVVAAEEVGGLPGATPRGGAELPGGVPRRRRARAPGGARRRGARVAPLCPAARAGDPLHRARPVHRRAHGAQHRDVRALHPDPSAPLLPRQVRLRPAALSSRARQLRADAQPAAQRPDVGPGRGRRDRGGARPDADVPAMKLGWVGFHMEGIPALEAVLEAGAPVVAVLTLKPAVAASRSGAADYRPLCRRFGVPLHEVTSINDPESRTLLQGLGLDLVFVIGWSQILAPETLATARLGMIGAHASLLPKNRG